MHIPNERMLLIESDLDLTFSRTFELLAARRQSEFRELVKVVGVAAISKAYSWAEVSAQYGLDTSIRWGKTYREARQFDISSGDAVVVKEAIEATSEKSERLVTYECILEGIDPVRSYFHIVLSDGMKITGNTDIDFPQIEWTTKKHYKAVVEERSVIKFSTGESSTTQTLRSLEPAGDAAEVVEMLS